MIIRIPVLLTLATAGLVPPALSASSLNVSATQDIYRATGYDDGSDGAPPSVYSFTAGPGQVLIVTDVSGSWSLSPGVWYTADGNWPYGAATGTPYGNRSIYGVGGMSGIYDTDTYGFLAAIFMTDSNPPFGTTPSPLRFYRTNAGLGGTPDDFTSLTPEINQVFFVGDGLTGQGTGAIQQFLVPPTATRLFLGNEDTTYLCCGFPGAFADNSGTLSVEFQITSSGGGPPAGGATVPEPMSFGIAALGLALIFMARLRRQFQS